MSNFPRLIKPVPTPLGLYFHPGFTNHTSLLQIIAEKRANMSGFVLDHRWERRQSELREEANRHSLETILATRGLDLSIPARHETVKKGIPWAADCPDNPISFRSRTDFLVKTIAEAVVESGYSAVLAPTHFLENGVDDQWFQVDANAVAALRSALNDLGAIEIPIYYPLAIPGKLLRKEDQRKRIIEQFRFLPIDAVWLRIHPFGISNTGPMNLRGYIEAGRDLQSLGIPIIGERTGTAGLPLLAFGAVSGIEGGVAVGESFNYKSLHRRSEAGKPFPIPLRVYIPSLGLYMKRDAAALFLQSRGMKSRFGCNVAGCCERPQDMLRDPRRHFLVHRMREVGRLGSIPEGARSRQYLEEVVRPRSDQIILAATAEPSLERHRSRLDKIRVVLGRIEEEGLPKHRVTPPIGRRVRHKRPA